MRKHVVIVTSGDTERRALPHLLCQLKRVGITLDVRVPPRHRALRADVAESLIKAAWFESFHQPPDKFVILVDVDRAAPDKVLGPLQQELPGRLRNLDVQILYAYAQQHLEAWYFADSTSLRKFLGRSLGSVDTSNPDGIDDPKRHLKRLLGRRVYTARMAEEIAKLLDPRILEQRSPSFNGLVRAVENGTAAST